MSRTARLLLFGGSATAFGVVLVIGLAGLPDFGHYHGVYGRVVDGVGVSLRHATDLVTALNFDFRAFDTLGEEFILFGSVLGVVLTGRDRGPCRSACTAASPAARAFRSHRARSTAATAIDAIPGRPRLRICADHRRPRRLRRHRIARRARSRVSFDSISRAVETSAYV